MDEIASTLESAPNNGTTDGTETPDVQPTSPQAEGVAQPDAAPEDSKAPGTITRENLMNAMFEGLSEKATEQGKSKSKQIVKQYLKQASQKHACCNKYNILVLYDNGTLVKSDADRIYNSITNFKNDKPLLLVLYSGGGIAGSAYLIGKLCVDNSNGKFVIVVPRMAKSAATLVCCAANEIHMGSLSELGPIDPQINDLPALGLKYSVEHIAELVKRYPASSDMFAKYLNSSLPVINLGYYERVAESAMQYAEKLLLSHATGLAQSPKDIANVLVYRYKDHSFVIDKSEAEEIFGSGVIKTNTEEYELGNELYMALSFLYRIADILDYSFYFTGSLDSDPVFTKKK
jgi:hypothetical protein